MADTAVVQTSEEQVQEQIHMNIHTDFSLGIFGTSDNFKMAWQMAQALAGSTVVPQAFQRNAPNCLIAIEQAVRLHMSPFMVMQNLYVIQGRPSWSSKFLIAMVNGSGKFDCELQFEETKDKDGKPYSCTAWAMKDGRRVSGMTVDMQMARDEGWYGKNGSKWKTMPQLMLRYRAASFFASLNCPELTLGLYTEYEMRDNDFGSDDEIAAVHEEIGAKANRMELPVIERPVVGTEIPAKKEAVKATMKGKKEPDIPDFMIQE